MNIYKYIKICVFRVEATWRLRENVVSALFRRGIHMECL